ncbi:MAG: hypothetical protein JWL77_4409 [Chthonomonadaceae bacterium]|nr:hypothetical protein [Chthonomonadaceae bacterium]
MAWIKTIKPKEADQKLIDAMQNQRHLYPIEYATRVDAATSQSSEPDESIVSSHSLLPDTLFHAFATYGTLLSPDLPLSRAQHEMIAATVSVANSCFY